jgi:hypothetical protein
MPKVNYDYAFSSNSIFVKHIYAQGGIVAYKELIPLSKVLSAENILEFFLIRLSTILLQHLMVVLFIIVFSVCPPFIVSCLRLKCKARCMRWG